MPVFPAGKLPAAHLEALLAAIPRHDPRVLVWPRPGEDAAVIDTGGEACLVVTTDPITFATDRIGWYAVHVNANDVAVMGARPRWFFLVLLLPAGKADETMVDAVMRDVLLACDSLGATLCGGHTEITPGLDRPIAAGQMIGEAQRTALRRKESLSAGDVVVLAGSAGIEGTAILAREKRDVLAGSVPAAIVERAAAFLDDPGISVVKAALAAAGVEGVRAMHDPTEGGIVTGLLELAAAAGLGILVHEDLIPVRQETASVCRALDADPLRLIASGALLAGVSPGAVDPLLRALAAEGVPGAVVAELRPPEEGAVVSSRGRREKLELPDRDEIARIFEGPRESS